MRRPTWRAKEMLAEMLLAEVRQSVGLTQEELAATLGIKQPTLSRLESQHDMQVSTLQRWSRWAASWRSLRVCQVERSDCGSSMMRRKGCVQL